MNDSNPSFLAEQKQAAELFNIGASDHEITSVLRKRISESENFYASDPAYKLETTRKNNKQMLYGDHYKAGTYPTLRDSSVKYQEPQTYAAIQTIISYATARIHEVEARPWNDSVAGRMIARDFAKFCEAHGNEHDLKGKIERMLYDLMQKRVGAIKLVVDTEYRGGLGEICPRHINPENLIFDHTTDLDGNPGFIAEKIETKTVQDLIAMYPKKKQEILEVMGFKQGTSKQLATKASYFEVWMTGASKDGKPEEQLVIFMGGLVLLKTRNPHWLYDVEEEIISNHLPMPPKPYITINMFNDGTNKLDQTSLIELVAPMQHALNRMKRSIHEAAHRYGGLNVFSGEAVDKEDVEDLAFDGDESIVVDAEDVTKAVNKISPDFLPQWIQNEAIDVRNTIHAIIGTPPNMRGDESDTETLGEAIMQRDQAEGRLEPLMRAMDNFSNKYYAMLYHLMKVYYTKEHWQAIAGEDGTFDYVMMSRDRLADGMDVYVKGGSNRPQDEQFMANIAVKLASMDRIDSMTLYEMLKLPKASEMYQRLVKSQLDPTLLTKDIQQEDGDRTAYMDFETIKAGEFTPPRKDPEVGHIDTHREQMMSDEFQELPAEVQQAFKEHVTAEIESLRRRAMAMENDLANKQATEESPMIPGNPGVPEPIDQPVAPEATGDVEPPPPELVGVGAPAPPMAQ